LRQLVVEGSGRKSRATAHPLDVVAGVDAHDGDLESFKNLTHVDHELDGLVATDDVGGVFNFLKDEFLDRLGGLCAVLGVRELDILARLEPEDVPHDVPVVLADLPHEEVG